MKIVTYNLRCCYDSDGVNSFVHRAGLILDTVARQAPDIICFQEATARNIGFLRRYLAPTYTVLLTQRETGLSGEGLAVAYRPEAISLYGLEVFWLSPTPQVIASKFPGQSAHSRICQKLLFKNEATGSIFRIYNLHLEELSEDVRLQQMALVLDRMAEETVPCLMLGDFNTFPGGKVHSLCTDRGLVDLTREIPGSFHGFGRRDPMLKLDYIFTDPDTAQRCGEPVAWDDCVNGIYLSDHYPIEVTCDL